MSAESLSAGRQKAPRLQPDWWRKTLAAVLLGFPLALVITGLFAWAGPGGIAATDKVQFNMWLLTLLWLLIMSLVYLFRSGNQALLWLGGANLLLWPLFLIVRGVMAG